MNAQQDAAGTQPAAPIVRPIVFTAHLDRWGEILRALGGALRVDEPGWQVYDLAGGRVALHPADPASAPGATGSVRVQLGLEVSSLEDAAGGQHWRRETAGHGETLTVHAEGIPPFHIDRTDGSRAPAGSVQTAPLVTTPDVDGAAGVLADLGLAPRLVSDEGRWADLTADGIVGVHIGELGFVCGFETDALEPLMEPLRAAGANPRIIDESYGRTLQFDDPDGGDAIWINETQTDLYGYQRVGQ